MKQKNRFTWFVLAKLKLKLRYQLKGAPNEFLNAIIEELERLKKQNDKRKKEK